MGEVYRARDGRLGREVAIKVLPEHLSREPRALARFEREMRVIASVAHPNIVVVYDCGTEGEMSYAAMELLEGQTLRQHGAMPWRKAVELCMAVAQGLAAAHARHIVHRDIKPENLFVLRDGRVKILDFGVASGEGDYSSTMTTLAMTRGHALRGTAPYMSPEQVRGEAVDGRSDLFSLGCVMYELLSGRRAFDGTSAMECMAAILERPPKALTCLDGHTPARVSKAIGRCLEKRREARFGSAAELAEALREILEAREGRAVSSGGTRGAGARRRKESVFDSLAVLPLVAMASDADVEYLADGISETLINALSQLPSLRVMARNTVFRLKGREADARSLGKELEVSTVVTGRLLRRGDRIEVRMEMVDVRDGAQLWNGRYANNLANLPDLEQSISRQIADSLRLRLTRGQRKRLGKRQTVNAEAYQLYLKGRFEWNRRTVDGLRRAIEFFEAAIAEDGNYALAWAGLADALQAMGIWGYAAPGQVFSAARAAAERALALDDTLAEAHTAMAHARKDYEYDWESAETEFKKAIELCPSYAAAHVGLGELLGATGRHAEAIERLEVARRLDPLSLITQALLGRHGYHHARQFDRAEREFRALLQMEPSFWVAHHFLGLTLAAMGDFKAAVESLRAARQHRGNLEALGAIGYCLARAGDVAGARSVLDELVEIARTEYLQPIILALVYTGLGETDQALDYLNQAHAHHNQWLNEVGVDPAFDPLRGDARFEELLKRLRLVRN
jgi:TolB-like protein/Tfp pilus assembly protein PilF